MEKRALDSPLSRTLILINVKYPYIIRIFFMRLFHDVKHFLYLLPPLLVQLR